ncbi:hypothetical protein CPB86DRAFT_841373 [Serendipita vermifera]|nr:hypothetical protein CPB86DRAFT_841373 [Serendipita vermifera]
MDDLDTLGKRSHKAKLRGTAVVVGGSISGLLTARVCADQFERVVIIEPDEGADTEYPASSSRVDSYGNKSYIPRRTRVAQTFEQHVIVYQPFVLLALRRLIPNFDASFVRSGGRIQPWAYNSVWSGVPIRPPESTWRGGRKLPRHPNLGNEEQPNTIWMTRANLEIYLRRHLLEGCSNVKVVNGVVTGLHEGAKGMIDKVTYTAKDGKNSTELDAALVVDCTGQSKAGIKWLKSLGYATIPEVSYDPLQRYITVWFQLTDEQMASLPIPPHLRDMGFYMYAFEDSSLGNKLAWASRGEGNTILLSFGGFGLESEDVPRTAEDLKEFYKSWKTWDGKKMDEWYCDLIDYLAKDGGWERAHFEECKIPACVWVKYHEVHQLPSNFVAIGDAVMRSSPIYGLGVTKAAVGVATLSGQLDRIRGTAIPTGFGKSVMDSQNIRTSWLWDQAKESDYGYPTTIPCEGDSLDVGAFTRAYIRELFRVSIFDEEAKARIYYPRLWTYPNSTMLSDRVAGLVMSRMQANGK